MHNIQGSVIVFAEPSPRSDTMNDGVMMTVFYISNTNIINQSVVIINTCSLA